MSDLVGNPEARFSQVAAQTVLFHEKTSIHITITETGTCTIKIFLTSVEIENFQLKLLFNILIIFAQNVVRGYTTLEPIICVLNQKRTNCIPHYSPILTILK